MQKIKNFFSRIGKGIKSHARIGCILIFHFEIGKLPDDEKKARGLKNETKSEVK